MEKIGRGDKSPFPFGVQYPFAFWEELSYVDVTNWTSRQTGDRTGIVEELKRGNIKQKLDRQNS